MPALALQVVGVHDPLGPAPAGANRRWLASMASTRVVLPWSTWAIRRYAWVFLLVVVVVLVIVLFQVLLAEPPGLDALGAGRVELSSALTLAETDADAARAQLEALVAGSGGNAIVAGFELAEIEARAGDTEAAAAALEALAEARGGDAYAKTASLFSAYTELDTAEPAEACSRGSILIAEDASFTALAMPWSSRRRC